LLVSGEFGTMVKCELKSGKIARRREKISKKYQKNIEKISKNTKRRNQKLKKMQNIDDTRNDVINIDIHINLYFTD